MEDSSHCSGKGYCSRDPVDCRIGTFELRWCISCDDGGVKLTGESMRTLAGERLKSRGSAGEKVVRLVRLYRKLSSEIHQKLSLRCSLVQTSACLDTVGNMGKAHVWDGTFIGDETHSDYLHASSSNQVMESRESFSTSERDLSIESRTFHHLKNDSSHIDPSLPLSTLISCIHANFVVLSNRV